MNEEDLDRAVDAYLSTALRWPCESPGDGFWPGFGPSSFSAASRKTAETDVRTFLEAALAESLIFDCESQNAAACLWLARQGGLRGGFLNADWGDRSDDLNALAAVFPKMSVLVGFRDAHTVEIVRSPTAQTFYEIHLFDEGRFTGTRAEVLAIWPSLEHRVDVLAADDERWSIDSGPRDFGIRWIVKRTIFK